MTGRILLRRLLWAACACLLLLVPRADATDLVWKGHPNAVVRPVYPPRTLAHTASGSISRSVSDANDSSAEENLPESVGVPLSAAARIRLIAPTPAGEYLLLTRAGSLRPDPRLAPVAPRPPPALTT